MAKRHNKRLSGLDWLIIIAFVVAIIAGVMAFRGYRWEKANTPQEGDLVSSLCYQWQEETGPATITGTPCNSWDPGDDETYLLEDGEDESLQYSSCLSSNLPKAHPLTDGIYFMLGINCRGKIGKDEKENNVLTLY